MNLLICNMEETQNTQQEGYRGNIYKQADEQQVWT